jgi:hypothetical protein
MTGYFFLSDQSILWSGRFYPKEFESFGIPHKLNKERFIWENSDEELTKRFLEKIKDLGYRIADCDEDSTEDDVEILAASIEFL